MRTTCIKVAQSSFPQAHTLSGTSSCHSRQDNPSTQYICHTAICMKPGNTHTHTHQCMSIWHLWSVWDLRSTKTINKGEESGNSLAMGSQHFFLVHRSTSCFVQSMSPGGVPWFQHPLDVLQSVGAHGGITSPSFASCHGVWGHHMAVKHAAAHGSYGSYSGVLAA